MDFVDSTNCSGFRKYSCGFRKFAYFLSNFERYNDLGICLWNPKQHRRSNKSSNVADSATNLILACCGFRLQCRECTVWPRNVNRPINMPRFSSELHLGRIKSLFTRCTKHDTRALMNPNRPNWQSLTAIVLQKNDR